MIVAAAALGIALAQTGGTPAPPSPLPAASIAPPASPGDAVITNSGSTNTAGYTIVVHPDGAAEVGVGGVERRATLERAQTAWLFAKLAEDAPLGSLPVAHCMRSASFGSVTRIAYRGEVTGDIGCGEGPALAELRRTVAVILGRLQVDTRRPRLRPFANVVR